MRKLPPLNALKAFESAARHRSFTAAARELSVTPGAVSRQVQVLEQFFGMPLFVPSGRGVEPTHSAARLATEIGPVFDLIASASERLVEPATANLIKINALPTFTFHWLFPRLARFQQRHPVIEPRLSASTARVRSVDVSVDVVIRRHPMTRSGFKCIELLQDVAVPVCTPELLAKRPIHEPQDLLKHSLLFSDTHAGRWEEYFAISQITPPRKRIKFEHFHVLLQAALEGLGVALGPTVLVEQEIRSNRLVIALEGPRVRFPSFYVLYRSEGSAKGRVRNFVDWLQTEARTFQREMSHQHPARDEPYVRTARCKKATTAAHAQSLTATTGRNG